MAVCLPGGADLSSYWESLSKGKDLIGEAPPGYDAAGSQRSGVEPRSTTPQLGGRPGECDCVCPDMEGLSLELPPEEMTLIAREELVAVHVAQAALADAGQLPLRHRIGVIIGCGAPATSAVQRLPTRGLISAEAEVRLDLRSPLAGVAEPKAPLFDPAPTPGARLISLLTRHLDLRGAAFTVDAGCASPIVAVDQAVAALSSGRCDAMLVGGVHYARCPAYDPVSSEFGASSPSQNGRPAQRASHGPTVGGAGLIVLKRLADAQRDNDRIYAVLRGCGVSGAGAPDSADHSAWAQAQSDLIRQAWHPAGLDPQAPGALGLLEALGDGSPARDAAALAALADVFGSSSAGSPQSVVGCATSMTSHATAATGTAALIRTALAIHHRVLPPPTDARDPTLPQPPPASAPSAQLSPGVRRCSLAGVPLTPWLLPESALTSFSRKPRLQRGPPQQPRCCPSANQNAS
ncbi:polyketide synthase [Streptomyces sp. NPDC056254]|uniref:beta-ketoacyl [acyl carrier protein] synthase domain-containing protein n=1 Tax=Streptomyces sp. NPDC056254 TaxID=3345763 RepID=UPI0035DA4338